MSLSEALKTIPRTKLLDLSYKVITEISRTLGKQLQSLKILKLRSYKLTESGRFFKSQASLRLSIFSEFKVDKLLVMSPTGVNTEVLISFF